MRRYLKNITLGLITLTNPILVACSPDSSITTVTPGPNYEEELDAYLELLRENGAIDRENALEVTKND
jgi:hypothetical protein